MAICAIEMMAIEMIDVGMQSCELTLMLVVANFTKKCDAKTTETLANGYLSESYQGELSNEYQHDRV